MSYWASLEIEMSLLGKRLSAGQFIKESVRAVKQGSTVPPPACYWRHLASSGRGGALGPGVMHGTLALWLARTSTDHDLQMGRLLISLLLVSPRPSTPILSLPLLLPRVLPHAPATSHFSFSHPPTSKESGSARSLCVLTETGGERERRCLVCCCGA